MNDLVKINVNAADAMNYVTFYEKNPIINYIDITNVSDHDLSYLRMYIHFTNNVAERDYQIAIDLLKRGETRRIKDIQILFNANYFVSLTEKSACQIAVEVTDTQYNHFGHSTKYLKCLTFDQWLGNAYPPQMLTAFMVPNYPVIIQLMSQAAKYLEKATGNPSLNAYQSHDKNRVRQMAYAAFAAIQKLNVRYAEPPASFERTGQRVRLPDQIINEKFGTCLDMTLLYAGLLEAMSLHTVLVMKNGHIFAGVWLVEDSAPNVLINDSAFLKSRIAQGINQIIVVECTMMCAGKVNSFDNAVIAANKELEDQDNFLYAIDVTMARVNGVTPLPIRYKTDYGFEVKTPERRESELTEPSKEYMENFDISDIDVQEQKTKIMQWEHKLLDLSLRNALISIKPNRAITLFSDHLAEIEDLLNDGEEFSIVHKPENIKADISYEEIEEIQKLNKYYFHVEIKNKRIHALCTEGDLKKSLTNTYRKAITSLDENGASNLYLTFGLLKWNDKKSATERYAPLVLVPVEMVRQPGNRGYKIRIRDDEEQINVTLLEYLKQNFEINIKGLNPLPTDSHGLDIDKIFSIIQQNLFDVLKCKVINIAMIGNFSFNQFVMWNDIHNNPDMLNNNKIIHSLIKGRLTWTPATNQEFNQVQTYVPVNVDSSQLEAIKMADYGESFVLYGPPGTGKSQTITAMIADLLIKGKKVLFVAEKKAALEVVQRRLAQLGIEDFCLELHSNKSTKKSILEQLQKGLQQTQLQPVENYEENILFIQKIKKDLDYYKNALHEQRSSGYSLHDLIDRFEEIEETSTLIQFDDTFLSKMDKMLQQKHVYLLKQLVTAGREIGHPHNHPLRIIDLQDRTYTIEDLKNSLKDYIENCDEFEKLLADTADAIKVGYLVSVEDYKAFVEEMQTILILINIPRCFLASSDIEKTFRELSTYIKLHDTYQSKQKDMLVKWNENFLRLDMTQYKENYNQANNRLLGKKRALKNLANQLQKFAKFSITVDQIPVDLVDVDLYQQDIEELEKKLSLYPEEFAEIIEHIRTEQELEEFKGHIINHITDSQNLIQCVLKLEDCNQQSLAKNNIKKVIELALILQQEENLMKEKFGLTFDETMQSVLSKKEQCQQVIDHLHELRSWMSYRSYVDKCKKEGLGSICQVYEGGENHDKIIQLYEKSLYFSMINQIINNDHSLDKFAGSAFNEKIAYFKELDQKYEQATIQELKYKLIKQLPKDLDSNEVSSELNILRRAIGSKGRGYTIRSLIDQIPHILFRLCPCMLMSPISVAQYIKPENNIFDLVIFDEASQIPTSKAIGVIARAKNALIAGDPNQMPPTSFFETNNVDEESPELEDLDSILTDCQALGMPSTLLNWHYRSRYESLIAFSNKNFYNSKMLTFPSADERERKVHLVKVNGQYSRGHKRINEIEGQAIVKEIVRRYQDEALKSKTIGVVTFNIPQQEYIENLLQDEFAKDVDLDRWAHSGNEPLFIKNLENVQGDERDIILFSITFGPDENGKISLNFGPINKDGGWKRLNVAVTRAREEMMVFSSLTYDMIDLNRTKNDGIRYVREFLKYAQFGQNVENNSGDVPHDAIRDSICKVLEDNNYQYQTNVGQSQFKIDIAVIDPNHPDHYLLGILLDGEFYKKAENTKDREISQIAILNRLGWKIHRIWAMDWWHDKKRQKEKLISILNEELGLNTSELIKSQSSEDSLEIIYESQVEQLSESEIEKNSQLIENSELDGQKKNNKEDDLLQSESEDSVYDQLHFYHSLLLEGLISQEDFEIEKRKILKGEIK